MPIVSPILGYITPMQAARLLKRNHSTICRYVRNGLLKSVRVPATIWLREEDVRTFKCPPRGNPMFRKSKT